MNILAINTAFNESYVAIKANSQIVLKSMNSSLKQSENILGLIDEALKEVQIDLASLNAIACVIGPGSFTGIRIGASIAKGFCSAISGIKRIGVNALDLVAYTFSKTNPQNDFWVVLNALSGNLFACKYNKFGERVTKPCLAFGYELENICGVVVGLNTENLEICSNHVELSSDNLLEYSLKIANKEIYDKDFIPLYLRKSQAEAELDKKNGNN